MTREEFIRRLQRGLAGLPDGAVTAITADYDSYFAEGLRAGRDITDLVAALGDPGRLAAELRLDAETRRWASERSLRSGLQTAGAALRLATIDLLSLLPLAMAMLVCGGALLGAIVVGLAGVFLLATAPFDAPIGGPIAAVFHSLGLIAGGVAGAAVALLAAVGLINALAWYGRGRRRVGRPLLHALASPGDRS